MQSQSTLSDLATEHSLDPESLAIIVDILGDHRVANPRVEGEWLVWDLQVSERTMEKRFRRLKSHYSASFMRPGRIGVHTWNLASDQ
jgi:hypothetical protein